jgi:hypothetical protein
VLGWPSGGRRCAMGRGREKGLGLAGRRGLGHVLGERAEREETGRLRILGRGNGTAGPSARRGRRGRLAGP